MPTMHVYLQTTTSFVCIIVIDFVALRFPESVDDGMTILLTIPYGVNKLLPINYKLQVLLALAQ